MTSPHVGACTRGLHPTPVTTLERYFAQGGISLVHAVFENTFFAAPAAVRAKPVRFPEYARRSLQHYPGLERGKPAVWQGQPVRLSHNARAQMAWASYTQPPLRGSGYSICHIWGHPWDPMAFTAGWNLAYMPNWARMLTEDQHPNEVIRTAMRQASWDLYFRGDPVCTPPDFVSDPDTDLSELLAGQPLLILPRAARSRATRAATNSHGQPQAPEEIVRAIRVERNQSSSNMLKAIAALHGRLHDPFGTHNVASSSKSTVRKMCRDAGLNLDALDALINRIARAGRAGQRLDDGRRLERCAASLCRSRRR
jgi:hypothetical protein